MSQTIITLAFEQWKAQQAVSGAPVLLDGFVLANVPDLDPATAIDRSEGLPPAAQIVHRQDVSQAGVINENAVAYSVTLGADVGDFSFNWIGLINKATNTVAMIVHAPVQQKVKNAAGQQGNVLTRSFVMEYNGAEAETQITTPAETWQIDFTARLCGMDERQRVENVDIYGPAAFFGDGYLVSKSGSNYSIAPGAGYVGGLRTQLAASQALIVTTKPVYVFVDVCFKGTLTSVWSVETVIKVASTLADYVADDRQHYVFAVASIDATGIVTDLRPKGSLTDQSGASDFARKDRNLADLDSIPKAREVLQLKGAALLDVGDKAGTVASGDDMRIVRAFQDGVTGSGRDLPAWNAKSGLYNYLIDGASAMVVQFCLDSGSTPAAQFKFNYKNGGICYRSARDNFGFELDWAELLTTTGTAAAATKLATARKISGVAFDGTADISLSASSVGALPISGGAMAGAITGIYNESPAWADQYSTKAPFYDDYTTANPSAFRPVVKQRAVTSGGSWAFSMGTLNSNGVLSWHLHMSGISGIGVNHQWSTNGDYYAHKQVVPGDYTNFDNRYFTQGTANARFVSGVRLGAQGLIKTDGEMTEAPGGCVITGGNGNEGNQVGYMYYRPLQVFINNAWVTVGAA